MKTILNHLLVLAALVLSTLGAPAARAQAPAASDVGVEEHLGRAIPLDLVLNGEDGKPVSLRTLLDKPTLLTLNYFRCAGICTPQLGGVADVLDKVQTEPGRDFQVITVSFDERDTPEMAAQKRANYLGELHRAVPQSGWRFLTGPPAVTKLLADAVGFRFKKEGDGFIHAGVAIMLSPQGKVTRYLYGTSYLAADLDLAVQEAARGEAQPSINKLLKFCYTYDPQGRRFVLNLTSVAAAFTLLVAVLFVGFLIVRGRKGMGR
jgi:protein SCO1